MIEVAPPFHGGREGFFSRWCWENWLNIRRGIKRKLDPYRTSHSRWIKDLNVKDKTMRLLEESIREHC